MRSFEHLDTLLATVPGAVVGDLRVVDVGCGAQASAARFPDLLARLAERARAAGIEASAAIDGIVVEPRARAAAILSGRAVALEGRAEQELAGCRAAYDHVDSGAWRPLDVEVLLDVHELLLHHTPTPGGRWKRAPNVVVGRLPDGTRAKRYVPVPVEQTPLFLDELVSRYHEAQATGRHHPVLLVGLFVLDLLAIHPFSQGNGRVARALTHALLRDCGYDVTRYVSPDVLLARAPGAYAGALLDATQDWHLGRHDAWPWLAHLVRTLRTCAEELAELTAGAHAGGSKQERVRDHVLHHARGRFRISELRAALPDVSDQTIRLVLAQLREQDVVVADGVGRGATWTRVRRSPLR